MGQHDALREGREAHEGEEAPAPRGRTLGRLTRGAKRLIVAVERGLLVAHENALGAPAREELCGVRVLGVPFALGQDQPHDVVRVPRGEHCPLLGGNDVVRGGDHGAEPPFQAREVVAQRGQGGDFGHEGPL